MSVKLRLEGDVTHLDAALEHAKHRLHEVQHVAAHGFNFTEALGAGALLEGLHKVIEHYQQIDRLAQRYAASAASVQRVSFVGTMNDLDMDTIARGINKFQIALQQATSGSSEAKDKLEALGLSAKELRHLDLDEQMFRLADAYQEAAEKGTGLAELQELMGKTAPELAHMLAQGGDALRELAGKTHIVSDEDIRRIDELDKALKKLKEGMLAIGAPAAGFITQFGQFLGGGLAGAKAFLGKLFGGEGLSAAGEAFRQQMLALDEIQKEEAQAAEAEKERAAHARETADMLEAQRIQAEKLAQIDTLRARLAEAMAKTAFESYDTEGKLNVTRSQLATKQQQIQEALDFGRGAEVVLKLRIEEESIQQAADRLAREFAQEQDRAAEDERRKAIADLRRSQAILRSSADDDRKLLKQLTPQFDEFAQHGFGYGGVDYRPDSKVDEVRAHLRMIISALNLSNTLLQKWEAKDEYAEVGGGLAP